MRRQNRKRWMTLGCAAAAAVSMAGCDLLQQAQQTSDCTTHTTGYSDTLSQEGLLAASVETSASEQYAMSLSLSVGALNRLFAAVAEGDLPPITFSDSYLGVPLTVQLDPDLPLIQLTDALCPTCLLTDFTFGLSIDVAGVGFSGTGNAVYQFPLLMRDNGVESTSVIGQFADSQVRSVNLQVAGIDPAIMSFLDPYIADAATALIQGKAQPYGVDGLGDTELFQLESWELGDGDVKLLGRGPYLHPEHQTIQLGMATNLLRPEGSNIELTPALPEGADLGMQFHPGLVQSMISRMMHEGHIDRTYNETGEPSPTGGHAVTMNTMASSETGLLRTGFRLWRTTGGFCGYADLQADLGLSITDGKIALAAENIQVIGGEGAGLLLQEAGNWLNSQFTNDLETYSEATVNYRKISLPEDKRADMSASTFQLNVDGRGLSIYLNIDNIVDDVVGP